MDPKNLLDMQVEDAERPLPFPVGTYLLEVQRHIFGEYSTETPYVRFFFKVRDVKDDVDKAELEKVKNWQDREPRRDFPMTDAAAYRLREFLEACGVVVKKRTFKQAIPEATGMRVWCYFRQTPAKDSDDIYNDLATFTKA